MVKMRILAALGAVLLLAATAARADDTAYPIKLQRPMKVGQKFTISSTVDETSSALVQVNGREVRKDAQASKYALEGTLAITAVDDKSRETGLHLTVKTLQVSKAGTDPVAVVEPGTEIDISYKDKKADFSRKGAQLSVDATEALSSIFSPPQSDQTDDDMFGTREKKKVGDSWPVNREAMSDDAAGSSILINPDKITGKVTLVSAGKLGDMPALSLKPDVDITDLTIPNLGKATVAHMQVSIEIQVPIDVADPSSKVTVNNMRHAIFEKDQPNGKAVVSLDSKSKRDETRLLVK